MLVAVLIMTGVGFVVKGAMNGDTSSELIEPQSVSLVKIDDLEVALKLQEALGAAGYSVMMTRSGDESLSLFERAEFANEVGADLFISLHQNAYVEDHSVNGIEVYYNNREKSVESEKITQLIQAGLITETGAKDRGIRAYNELVVTRETTMPSCLVEMGYMSNPTELSLMNSDSYQDKTVTGIVNGINQFFE